MKSLYLFIALAFCLTCAAQNPSASLEKAIADLQKDPQFSHALIGLYVTTKSGEIVYDKNANVGMTPASTLKVLTSVTAFELLGKSYQFKTDIGIDAPIKNGIVDSNLRIIGGGDPTLGSKRWSTTRDKVVLQKLKGILAGKRIDQISGSVVVDEKRFLYPPVPNGWIWEDIGNYYGAGAWGLNWLENKYEVHLSSTSEVGKATQIVSTYPVNISRQISNFIVSGAKGSGDNAYLFSGPYSEKIFANGTIPAGEKDFVIYGAMPLPSKAFIDDVKNTFPDLISSGALKSFASSVPEIIGSIYSPPLDSINFWFLRESVNLFGEAMVKAIAIAQDKKVSTGSGVESMRDFWSKNGVEKSAIKIIDGSGLSPANKITPKALVQILEVAKSKSWFSSFYHALPEMNGIKMKSGYIGGVRSYAGYIKGKRGQEYAFAFIINNFDGAASTVREKMYKVLNLLK